MSPLTVRDLPALAAVFLAAACVAASALAWWDARSGPVARRLQEVYGELADDEDAGPAAPVRRASWLRRRAEPNGQAALFAAAGAVVGFVIFHLPGLLAGAVTGYALPGIMARRQQARRLADFNRQLPNALGIMASGLRAGCSFLQSLDSVAEDLPDPIGAEFRQVVKELRVNIAVEDALVNLVVRVGGRDLDLMVTAVLIQRQVGGNLAGVLEQIAETIRERVRLQAEVRALTAQGRLSGWIVGLLPVGLGLAFEAINPHYLSPLIHSAPGLLMLGVAVAMEIVGALLIRRMVRLEV